MKKIILLGLLVAPISSMAMHSDASNSPSPINDHEYECYGKYNWVQAGAWLWALDHSGIDLSGKDVLYLGCGAGNIAKAMVEKKRANSVYGIDTDLAKIQMLEQLYGHVQGVRFAWMSLKEFLVHGGKQRDCLTSFFHLSQIQNKQAVFADCYRALAPGGMIMCTITTNEEQCLQEDIIAHFLSKNIGKYPSLQGKDFGALMDIYSIAQDDLKTILIECGFKTVKMLPIHIHCGFCDKDEYIEWQRPLFMASPFLQLIPQQDVHDVFYDFVDALWQTFEKSDDGEETLYPLTTTILTAQKPR